jgi:membrane protein implicated in regulation of membrane protease activity
MNYSMTSDRIELFARPGIGEVVKMITPGGKGRIKFRATFWPARFYPDAQSLNTPSQALPSEQVVVVGRDGITLLVTPITSAQIA